MRRIQRNEKTSTGEHSNPSGTARERNNRRTTAFNDMSIIGNMRRVQSPRRSMMPPPSQLDMSRRCEPEGNNNEMSLLYEKYLQTLLTEHIMEKKEIEREKKISTHFASLEKKNEECDMKLHEIKMRMNELEPLNDLQKNLESQVQEIETFLEITQTKVTELLDKIYSNLESFDKLACKNVIIPEVTESLIVMHDLLNECNQLLDSIGYIISNNSMEVISTNNSLKKFQELISITEKLMKRLHNNLTDVQIDLLKKGSATLNANNM